MNWYWRATRDLICGWISKAFKYTKNTLYNLNLIHSAALVHPLQWSSSTETIFFFPKRNKAMNKKTSRINSVLVLSLQDCTNLIWICVPVPGSIKSLILEAFSNYFLAMRQISTDQPGTEPNPSSTYVTCATTSAEFDAVHVCILQRHQ